MGATAPYSQGDQQSGIDGINENNERNPDNRIIYLNCGAAPTAAWS
jgi:hypothetical protein